MIKAAKIKECLGHEYVIHKLIITKMSVSLLISLAAFRSGDVKFIFDEMLEELENYKNRNPETFFKKVFLGV